MLAAKVSGQANAQVVSQWYAAEEARIHGGLWACGAVWEAD